MKKATLGLILLLAMVLPAMLCACGSNQEVQQEIKSVHVQQAGSQSKENVVSYTGTVTAKETRNLSFESGGVVAELLVKEGQKVSAGQTLARLDTKNLQLAVTSAQNQLENAANSAQQIQKSIETARVTLTKTADTYASNITQAELALTQQKNTFAKSQYQHKIGELSDYELSSQKIALDTAQNQLNTLKTSRDNDLKIQRLSIEQLQGNLQAAAIGRNTAQTALDKAVKDLKAAVITAPFNGYVLKTAVKQGEMTGAGTPVLIVKADQEVINTGVPVEKIGLVKSGMTVTVKTADEQMKGKITQISLYPDETTRTYNVEVLPEDQTLPLGSLITVGIPSEKINGCFVPVSAVINLEGVAYVYSAEKTGDTSKDNAYKVVRHEAQLGNVFGDQVELKNISSDMNVIVDGVKDLRENEAVLIAE